MARLDTNATKNGGLARVVSTRLLVLYGVGAMLGAGIFALIGEVAAAAGSLAPLSFLIAALIAGLTAASFAELSSRLPSAAGPAAYVRQAFSSDGLAVAVGAMMIASGVVSSGAMFRAFAGYAQPWLGLPEIGIFLGLAIALGALAAWGIAQSVMAIAAITILEAGALLIVIGLGVGAPPAPAVEIEAIVTATGVLSGATLAFYAFIGFEDMVNVAEEVKRPQHAMPRAIVVSLIVTTLIYIAVAWTAVRVTPLDALKETKAPMTLIYAQLTDFPGQWLRLIAMIAVINGALVQIIMASRMLYGLARQGNAPAWCGAVSRRTQTPVNATMLVALIIFVAAALLPLATLARATAFLLLCVFALSNAALIKIKRAEPTDAAFSLPIAIPVLGAVVAVAFAALALFQIVTE